MTLDSSTLEITIRLLVALAIGGVIGIERSFHGRPAGFRTHALVCLSTSLLMLITVYEERWIPKMYEGRVVLDPTRTAQGIMTGIGFLGAGAIIKDGLTVRGLTTAASIWVTAALGIMIGIGFYEPALIAAVLTLGTLSVFRWVERAMPSQFYAQFVVRFDRAAAVPEEVMREIVQRHGFSIANLNYRLDDRDGYFEYRMVICAARRENAQELAKTLNALATVKEFRLSPTGD
jgi:putative Mg2+ transporter-C (MgtC) family protein